MFPSLYFPQERPQDGPHTAELDRGGRVRTDQDAQLPAVRVEPSARQFFQVQHLSTHTHESLASTITNTH